MEYQVRVPSRARVLDLAHRRYHYQVEHYTSQTDDRPAGKRWFERHDLECAYVLPSILQQ
jgi:hypothetical protein